MSKHKTFLYTLLAILIFAIPTLIELYTDYLWFSAQNLSSVYFTTISYQIATFVLVAILSFSILSITQYFTQKNIHKQNKKHKKSALVTPVLLALSLLIATAYSTQWEVILRYLNSYAFQAVEPIYNQNIAFYVYQLPFYELVISLLTTITTIALLSALTLYALHFKQKTIPNIEEDIIQTPQTPTFSFTDYFEKIKKYAYPQLLILTSILLLTTAAGYYFARYELLLAQAGAVFGVGYVDYYIQRPGLLILSILAVLAAITLLYNIKKQQDKLVTISILTLVIASILLTGVTTITQSLLVEPDEINKEYDFIEHEIQHTRQAYALDRVDREELEVSKNLTREQLQSHQPTINNARLWDDRPLLRTLNELQIFRTYYTFPNVDVDRYEVNGEKTLMMLAARELDTQALNPQSQTWVNKHLVYTHGFGLTMNPASKITTGNLPELVIQDIPPTSTVNINVTQPRIYYGQQTRDYAIVNTQTAELDYPSGEQNVRINYPGEGGVQLDSLTKQLAYAAYFQAPQILFSGSITDESRIQYNRQITQRAQKLAPFLQYDNDPYIVISESGELYWIQDAYTTTSNYPYSRPTQNINYIRNSAKAVINAYSGEVTFYISEEEPLIQTYKQAYPDLFKDLEEMPQDLKDHIRYPQDFFSIQASKYQDYHMTNPSVFYNKEDSWRIPNEVVRGVEQTLQPYYQIMQLPGNEQEEFIQVQPFIPRGRENLIGWLAARSDENNYGELKAYHFSKQELTFGPMQVESRIDQDTEISQQITLWSSAGSGVVRGNLLVIPIEDTILYVEPLFLEAREQGALPQLMRVIVAHEDKIAMAPTLQAALDAIIDPTLATPVVPDPQTPVITDNQQIQEIREAYQAAQQALESGDLRVYADRLDELEELLNQ